ncbi:hypothetical protein DUNSADRAFT_9024 [Dunaliella salina]|uniref:N-alpha-acetyltransferase 60 n=1 Tax=Dunaliella salina TaxID=3046 RepID=A0ABQ7GID9_DUNSA|nr:hypothetical protein DUNSADRAFT_9024 [Dunaliella salina]|eukprot:KAF5834323.1 hypothetical protein DUNSADRAFT_9024 [Dunaliella salina]
MKEGGMHEAHLQLFPIKYEDTFFNKAVNSLDRIFSFAAFESTSGYDELAGFITARLCFMYELDNVDRFHISQSNPNSSNGACTSTAPAVYILTLGVVPSWQKCGVASSLLALARQHAIKQLRCCVIYLHVISYNEAAIGLYMRNQYQCLGLLKDFYSLPCGPQPNAARMPYDAYLFVQYLPFNLPVEVPCLGSELQGSGKSSWLAPVAQVSNGLGSILSFGSVWQAWGQVNSCIPWLLPRQPNPAMQPPVPLLHNYQQQDRQMAAPHAHGVSSMSVHNTFDDVQQHTSSNEQPGPVLQAQVPQAMLQQQQQQQQHYPAPHQQHQQHQHQLLLQKYRWQQDGHENRVGASENSKKSSYQTPSLFRWFTSPPR